MTRHEQIEKKTEQLVLPMIESLHFELVDTEYVKEAGTWYLRVFIDKEGGITVDDCEVLSRQLSDALDVDDFVKDAYILEVSSPGLERPLKKEKDYVRNMGRDILVRTYQAIDGEKEFVGTLAAYTNETVTLTNGEESLIIERTNISLIREYVDFDM